MNSSLEKTLDSDPILELKILIFLPFLVLSDPDPQLFSSSRIRDIGDKKIGSES